MESEKERMTDLRQLERDTQNIQGVIEHGSYCECLCCLEESIQPVEASDLARQEMEQAMTAMLKDLSLPITITKQDDLYSGKYIWQCMGITGKANSFVDATREALQSLVGVFAFIRA